MENTDKIKTEDLAEEINVAIKDTFIAQTRKFRDEIHMKFPNGQTFTLAVWEERGGRFELREEGDERERSESPFKAINRQFERNLSNWIMQGLVIAHGVQGIRTENGIEVLIESGQEYIIKIQKK